ncbi:MAG: phytanoyl-CoA dioxygenase family protein [Myxococcota bacterium]
MSAASERRLTDKMVEHYWEHGYTLVPGVFDKKRIQDYLDRFDGLVEGTIPRADNMLVMRDIMIAKGAVQARNRAEEIAKIQDFESDEVLWSYVTDPHLLDCIDRIVGHDVFTLHTMLINKPPNVDGRHPLHQDLLYFPFRPADKIVAGWTALERITKENGCLTVVPGSHHNGLLKHENPDWEYLNGAYFGAQGVGAETERVYIEMEPGDTVLFHPITLHGSGRNKTQGFRRAISAHFASTECEWEWNIQRFVKRKYKIVRGEGVGTHWKGSRNDGPGSVDPLDYFPKLDTLKRARSGRS